MKLQKRMSAAAILVALLISLSYGAVAAENTRYIQVGGEETITASVANPLSVPDVIHLSFDGSSTEKGMIEVNVPKNSSNMNCYEGSNRCMVFLDPEETRTVSFTVTSSHPGRSRFTVEAKSMTTDRSSTATMMMVVSGEGILDSIVSFFSGLFG